MAGTLSATSGAAIALLMGGGPLRAVAVAADGADTHELNAAIDAALADNPPWRADPTPPGTQLLN